MQRAINTLRSDGIVAIPTETVYGLAASIASTQGLQAIFTIKSRPFFDPLIVHVTGVKMAQTLVQSWPHIAQLLAERFWPGPLTLVLPKSQLVSDLITSGLPTVAIRSPNHPLAQRLIEEVGPLAAPSANRFGKTSPTTPQHVRDEFSNEDLLIVDGGPCQGGIESTVIEIDEPNRQIFVLRPGLITKTELKTIATPMGWEVTVQSSLKSPGQLKHHYQPNVPLIIYSEDCTQQQIADDLNTRVEGSDASPPLKRPRKTCLELNLPTEPQLAARVLYNELRTLDEQKPDWIYVKRPSYYQEDDWTAIWDRLQRAATVTVFCESTSQLRPS